MNWLNNLTNPLFNYLLDKPEVIISIFGWLVTYWFVIRAQDKQHKNEINHEVYKELIHELDVYAGQLSEYSSMLTGFKLIKSFQAVRTEKQAFHRWLDGMIEAGLNLKFFVFLQKWESYEIFVQNMKQIMLIFKKENDAIREKFQETFLFHDPIQAYEKNNYAFEANLDALQENAISVSCYLMDFKKVLQNYFYKQYGLKAVEPRKPEDNKYLVLTEKGLIHIMQRNWFSRKRNRVEG